MFKLFFLCYCFIAFFCNIERIKVSEDDSAHRERGTKNGELLNERIVVRIRIKPWVEKILVWSLTLERACKKISLSTRKSRTIEKRKKGLKARWNWQPNAHENEDIVECPANLPSLTNHFLTQTDWGICSLLPLVDSSTIVQHAYYSF